MKIQHKRSNQLDGGLAKQPTSEFMEYGELAVNFNETDPAIFLKDSNDNIVRIAGAGAEGVNDVIVSATAPSTTGLLEGQLWWNSDSTSGKLFVLYNDPSGGGGTDAGGLKWVETSPTPEIPTIFPDLDDGNNQPGTLDDRYLSTEADAGNQTVASTGTTTFVGNLGAPNYLISTSAGTLGYTSDKGSGIICYSNAFADTNSSGDLLLLANKDLRLISGTGNNIYLEGNVVTNKSLSFIDSSVSQSITFDGSGNAYGIRDVVKTLSGPFRSSLEANYSSLSNTGTASQVNGVTVIGMDAGTATSANPNLTRHTGYYSFINTGTYGSTNADGVACFNYYADGTAPNFFSSSTYIGGTPTRNTRELWESLLTEEQKEQLSAGTLAIPANVSTPGDGSFARQWWYDQQDAENQALLDSGELEYPAPYAAATFADTFTLGTTTSITLGSNSTIDLKGFINFSDTRYSVGVPKIGFNSNNDNSLATYTAGVLRNYIDADGTTNVVINDRAGDAEGYKTIGTLSATSNAYAGFWSQPTSPVGASADNSINYVSHFLASPQNSFVDKFASGDSRHAGFTANAGISGALLNAGFYGELEAGNPNSYNFYALGDAPNYFAGDVRSKGRLRVSSDPNASLNDPGISTNSGVWAYAEGSFSIGRATATQSTALLVLNRSGSTTGRLLEFRNAGTIAGYIDLNGSSPANGLVFRAGNTGTTAAAYTIDSDRRLKTNIIDAPSAVELVKALKPRQYDLAVSKNVQVDLLRMNFRKLYPKQLTAQLMQKRQSALLPMLKV